MLFDYQSGKLILIPEINESFIQVQDHSTFLLSETIKNGEYRLPYAALPMAIQASRNAGYSVSYTDALKDFHKDYLGFVRTLQEYKDKVGIEMNQDFQQWLKGRTLPFSPMQAQIDTVQYALYGERIVIGNGIGTGKTYTANLLLMFLLDTQRIRKALVMTPASLVGNYYKDFCKFFPKDKKLCVAVQKQEKSKRIEIYKHFNSKNDIQMLIVNYEKCLFDYEYMLEFKNIDALLCDEFHYMKNFLNAQRSVNFFEMLLKFNPRYRIAMSGTPIENRLFDLYPVFKMLGQTFAFGDQRFFENNFVQYEDFYFKIKVRGRYMTKFEKKPVGFKNSNTLKNLIRPFIIKKKLHLPVALYSNYVEIKAPEAFKEEYQTFGQTFETGSKKYHAMRQFLNNPGRDGCLIDPKINKFEEIVEQIDEDEKVIVFSFYKTTAVRLSQWAEEHKQGYLVLNGDTLEKPEDVIEEFKKKQYKFLFCSDRVNFGHNIQFCRYVINYDIPLKPSTLMQRLGRSYRQGQVNDVHAFHFVVMDTVEEKIYNYFVKKRVMIEEVYDTLDYTVDDKEEELDEKKLIQMT